MRIPSLRVLAAVANWPGWSAEKAPTIGAVIQEIVRAGDREASLKDALKSIRFENAAKPEQGPETQVFIHTADAKEPRTISVVRVDYFNSENANDGLLYSVRHSGATVTLHTTAGYDDVTGLGTPTAAFYSALASWGK